MSLELLQKRAQEIKAGKTIKVTVDPEWPILQRIRRFNRRISRIMWRWVFNE
jgi:hypothetical protein